MAVKDYYKILELPSKASITEVKKNFRRLALRYHPDTNTGNPYAEAWYREIQEAYETLSNTKLRERYLQERWLLKSQGKAFAKTVPLTPPFILKQMLELREQVKNMDHFRMSHLVLQQQLLMALHDDSIDVLLTYDDADINRQEIVLAFETMSLLDFKYLAPLIKQLHKLTVNEPHNRELVDDFIKQKRSQYLWDKYQVLFFLLLTILLCAVIYFS